MSGMSKHMILSSNTKRTLSSCGSSYLSEELIFNILSNTCVTSLLGCKSVCKLWHSIISKPNFMIAHHIISVNKLPSIIMITSRVDDSEGCHATVCYPDSLEKHSVNIPLNPPFDHLEFVSSFNGVVCVFNKFFGDIYLLNPLTKNFKKLSLPPAVATVSRRPIVIYPAPPRPYSASMDCSPTIVFDNRPPLLKAWKVDVGFGFDCVSCDFKVLLIEYRNANNTHVDLAAVNLYRSSSDSWRSIEVGIDLPSLLYYPFCPVLRSGPVVDGVLYMEGADVIVTFDLHNELFGLISYPSFVHTRKSNVLDFEGSVAVVLETVPDGSLVEKELSLWTLVAVSDDVTWNKMFTFNHGLEEIDWLFLYSESFLSIEEFAGVEDS
ncbi:putative F-box protein At4g09190 isoform X2 [Apium graveolens]|uniref:putative F-box protein At4g09190 isoform X2 n=1 Tax=Apium graveolens TaxID=4045 RepID=UPI003D7B5F62